MQGAPEDVFALLEGPNFSVSQSTNTDDYESSVMY